VNPSNQLSVTSHLTDAEVGEISELVAVVLQADGLHPLSEHVWLHVSHGGDNHDQHFLMRKGGVLVGYAHLDATDGVAGPSAELAVHPAHRRIGVGRELVESMLSTVPDKKLRLWAHGEQLAAIELARSMNFINTRVLWQMRRSLRTPLSPPVLPPGIRLRTFSPDLDAQAWLELNSRAFANHPEQGGWLIADLESRMGEPWFSTDGFILAIADDTGDIAGFHWTKVHGATGHAVHAPKDHAPEAHAHEALGEVYVVGVDPNWQGTGLGRAITVIGLQHLRDLGLSQAMLYVDATNSPALKLYSSLGFTRWDTDVLYQRDTR
jgi:mycothiol synthase